jgi:hypothetical protein
LLFAVESVAAIAISVKRELRQPRLGLGGTVVTYVYKQTWDKLDRNCQIFQKLIKKGVKAFASNPTQESQRKVGER